MHPTVAAPPRSETASVVEFFHGIEVTDPYRWLEDQDAPRTRDWIEAQTVYTRAYFEALPERELVRRRVQRILECKRTISEPWQVGEQLFFLKYHSDSEQPSIVMRDGLFSEDRILIDPALREHGSHCSVSIMAISHDGRFLAYAVRLAGTDYSSVEIVDVPRGVVLHDSLPDGFCHGFCFAPDGTGFYYCHQTLRDTTPSLPAVYWHAFGSDRLLDQETFAAVSADSFTSILCSPEAGLLAYPVFSTGNSRNTSLYVHTLPHKLNSPRLLLEQIGGCFVPFFVRDRLFAYTDFQAPNFRIVHIELNRPDPAHWKDVVPETSERIQQFAVVGNQVFVTRAERFATKLEAYGLDDPHQGKPVKSIFGTIDLLNRDSRSNKLFYSQSSINEAPAVHCYDAVQTVYEQCDLFKLAIDDSEITTQEVSYPSRDGTSIPLLLATQKCLVDAGPLPTFLTGYGGFGSCVTPRFTAFATFLIEQGFLFATPALRGGAELGEEWHRAGMRHNRQNAFDDFIAAAEWLITNRRSDAQRMAIGGGSNAGLLVGAAITQRPDLFRAAICLGPLLDMMRYHLFDLASRWIDEYGSPEDEQDAKYLLSYSPYHKVREGVSYPAVLLISGDADTRCNPMHARKMTARLQAATGSDYSILLDYKAAWGHTPAQPHSVRLEALIDRLAFICHELGIAVREE